MGGGWLLRKLESCLTRYIPPNSGWPDEEVFRGVPQFVEHFSEVGKRKRSEQLQAKLVGHYRAGRRKYIKEHEFESKESIARMESRETKALLCSGKRTP